MTSSCPNSGRRLDRWIASYIRASSPGELSSESEHVVLSGLAFLE